MLDKKNNHEAVLQKFEKALENLNETCEEEIEHIKTAMRNDVRDVRTRMETQKDNFCGVIKTN